MFHWPRTLELLSQEPEFKKRYTTEDLPLLKAFLADVKARNDHLDATVYANNDWRGAPRADERRLELAIELLEKGVQFVEPFEHNGVSFGKLGILSPNKMKWMSYKTKQWYWYSSIDALMKQFGGSAPVDVKALMLKKQKESPDNPFWHDEAAVKQWLQAKGKEIT